jgi:hypothetical protein
MKTRPHALGTAENMSGSGKNMKTGPNALGIAENMSVNEKHENEI